jgi:hypothetical protein
MFALRKIGNCTAILAALIVCARAAALPLAPGGILLTPPEPDPVGGVLIAGGVPVPFVSAPSAVPFTGTLTASVITGDVTNPFGGLTFTFRLHNDATSLSSFGRFTTLDFSGFLTDVSYQAPGLGRPSTSTDRSVAPGVSVGWDFSALGLGRLLPGEDSALLVIQTDAHGFTGGSANIIDGSIATSFASFAPAVPEPASIALLAIGGASLMRRRSKVA